MRSRSLRPAVLLPAVLLLAAFTVVACGEDDEPTGPQPEVWTATLNAANERQANPVNSPATGTARVELLGNTLSWNIAVNGLVGNLTNAHIHEGPATRSGNVVLGFFPGGAATVPANFRSGTVTTGSVDLSAATVPGLTVSVDSLRRLLATGNAYVNVHSASFGQGEVRGQLTKQ